MIHKRSRKKPDETLRTAAGNIPIGLQSVRTFQSETSRQKRAVEAAFLARAQLNSIVDAVARLNSDPNFLTLLRAEVMHTAPKLVLDPPDLEMDQTDGGSTDELLSCGAMGELIELDVETSIRDLKSGVLTSIQEHYLLLRLLNCGVSKEFIAGAVGVGAEYVRFKARLLDEISPVVVDLFKDLRITPHVFDVLRKMTEKHQIEVANLMIAAGNHSYRYARGLLAATRQSDLVKPKRIGGVAPAKMAQMEQEMGNLQSAILCVGRSYGDDMLNLAIARGYIAKLTSNGEIERYLEGNHPGILEGFRGIMATASLA